MYTAWCFPLICVCFQCFSWSGSWRSSELSALFQVCSCVTEACWGAACFSSWGGGFLFPAIPPVVCFAPALSLPMCTAGSCLTLLMETVPCRCLKILPFPLPACSHTHGINALCQLQLPLWSRSSTLSPRSNFRVVSGDSAFCPCSWLRPCT